MKKKYVIVFGLLISSLLSAQNTLGTLLNTQDSFDGYILFSPRTSDVNKNTYLINNCGEIINQWPSTFSLFSTDHLMPDGSLFRSVIDNQSTLNIPGNTGRIEHLDWDNNTIWALTYSDTDYSFHHDYVPLANGNILMLVARRRTVQEALDNGRDPSTMAQNELYEEQVIEIEPVGTSGFNIVWEWNSWEHLIQDFDNTKLNFGVVADHPELLDINFGTNFGEADWWHSNALSYSPELDQVLISNRNLNEFIILDHSTTTAEAATGSGGNSGMGGDIIYRYGNPQSYDQGDETDRKLFGQHNVHFIPSGSPNAGKIMIFNNGLGFGHTRIQIITPPYDSMNQNYTYTGGAYGPDTIDWEYEDPIDPLNFFSSFLSGAQELANGNVLICSGANGILFEVDMNSNTVWQYQSPVANSGVLTDGDDPSLSQLRVFRALKYSSDFSGFDGKDLTPGAVIEINPNEDNCELLSVTDIDTEELISIYPTVVEDLLNINTLLSEFKIEIYNISGQLVLESNTTYHIDLSLLNSGLYFVQIESPNKISTIKILKK